MSEPKDRTQVVAIAEIEREAVEKAMKVRCRYCLEGIPRHHEYHKTDGAGTRCEAWPIPQLIDEALQGKEEPQNLAKHEEGVFFDPDDYVER